MKQSAIESFIIGVLKGVAGPSVKARVRREAEFLTDLEVDSIAILSVVFSIDEKYGVGHGLGEHMSTIKTVGDLISVVEKLVQQKQAVRVDS